MSDIGLRADIAIALGEKSVIRAKMAANSTDLKTTTRIAIKCTVWRGHHQILRVQRNAYTQEVWYGQCVVRFVML